MPDDYDYNLIMELHGQDPNWYPGKPAWYYTERDPIHGTTAFEEAQAHERWVKRSGECSCCGRTATNGQLEETSGYCSECATLVDEWDSAHPVDWNDPNIDQEAVFAERAGFEAGLRAAAERERDDHATELAERQYESPPGCWLIDCPNCHAELAIMCDGTGNSACPHCDYPGAGFFDEVVF